MKMNRWLTIGAFFSAALFLSFAPAPAKEKDRVITPGDFFPDFSFPMTLSKGEVEYLGLPTKFLGLMKGESFSLKDVKADVILVEYMNKYCFSCQLQAPVLNQVFESGGERSRAERKSQVSGGSRRETIRPKWTRSGPRKKSPSPSSPTRSSWLTRPSETRALRLLRSWSGRRIPAWW